MKENTNNASQRTTHLLAHLSMFMACAFWGLWHPLEKTP